jgi:hypothetical protein
MSNIGLQIYSIAQEVVKSRDVNMLRKKIKEYLKVNKNKLRNIIV